MSKCARVRQSAQKEAPATDLSISMKRIAQLERDQKADEVRINAAISKAESEIARLEHRNLDPDALWSALWAIRDKTVLMTRDVRKNMHKRTAVAKEMQETLSSDFIYRSNRFAIEDSADAALRTRFFNLLERTPTPGLIDHLKDAIENGNFACAESIRFEFKCREDRHLYSASFEAIEEQFRDEEPAEMQMLLVTIANAAATIDRRVTDLLQKVSP
jgi:hypothetical protein